MNSRYDEFKAQRDSGRDAAVHVAKIVAGAAGFVALATVARSAMSPLSPLNPLRALVALGAAGTVAAALTAAKKIENCRKDNAPCP